MERCRGNKLLDIIFEWAIAIKGVNGFLETIGGLLLFLISPKTLGSLVVALTQRELIEDPNDFFLIFLSTRFTRFLLMPSFYSSLFDNAWHR